MSKFKSIPFWSWNDELNEEELREQIRWMNSKEIGGFFMHARSGLKTEYMSKKWMECIEACVEEAEKLGMQAWAYDENGWPSGFCGGKLLEDEENCDMYLLNKVGEYDETAFRSYKISGKKLELATKGEKGKKYVNVYLHRSVSTADILNEKVVKKFIDSTHERYKNEIKGKIHGFFTDEPQYFRWDTPYTQVLPDYFYNKYGEDVNAKLGLLFYDYEGYKEFRYKYFKCMQELMVSSFSKQIYDWCEANGYKLTGHYVQEDSLAGQMLCCADIMAHYEYQHIPGIDHLGRKVSTVIKPKQLDSVCCQLGKELRLAEIFAMVGWDATPLELKGITDGLYAMGVNVTCQHLLPVSERGSRKRDYPEHFSAVNPWCDKNFEEFNGYYNKLAEILYSGTAYADVAIFHPIRSAYFDYKRSEFDSSLKWLESEFLRTSNKFNDNHIQFHYIDEVIMARHGRVENGKLIVGNCSYKFIVFPSIYTMDKSSYNLISEFIKQGGKIYFDGIKPTYLEYTPFKYSFKSNVTFNQIKNAQPYVTSVTSGVNSRYVINENGEEILFLANVTNNAVTLNVFKNKIKTLEGYDLAKNETYYYENEVTLNGYQSLIIKFKTQKIKPTPIKKRLYLGETYDIVAFKENYLTLDRVSYSYNGVDFSEDVHVLKLFENLLKDRYKGDLYVKYSFNANYIPKTAFFTAEHDTVYFNGELLKNPEVSRFGKGFYKFNLSNLVKIGKNEAVLKYNYYQNDLVYYALFGENVTESVRNCMVYDTELESAYLSGDFAVSGEFYGGENPLCIRGKNFVVTKPNLKGVTSLIKNGFPFLSGEITLKQKLSVSETDYILTVDKRFNLLELKINGKNAGKLMLYNEIDVSKLLKKGDNDIELTLTLSNRNTLGPFHATKDELDVGPNTWSINARDDYSFVKTII